MGDFSQLSGQLLPGAPTLNLEAATKAYVDGLIAGRLLAANNLSDVASVATALANLGGQPSLVGTNTKTAAYTASMNEFVKADASAGAFTVTVPTPSGNGIIGVRKTDSTNNVVTVTDGGSLSFQLKIPDESRLLILASGSWFQALGLQTPNGLDSRYQDTVVRNVSPSAGARTLDVTSTGHIITCTTGSSFTENIPTGATDGQSHQIIVNATAAITVTFNASFARLTGVASTLPIASGKLGRYSLRYTTVTGSGLWIVEAAAATQ